MTTRESQCAKALGILSIVEQSLILVSNRLFGAEVDDPEIDRRLDAVVAELTEIGLRIEHLAGRKP